MGSINASVGNSGGLIPGGTGEHGDDGTRGGDGPGQP